MRANFADAANAMTFDPKSHVQGVLISELNITIQWDQVRCFDFRVSTFRVPLNMKMTIPIHCQYISIVVPEPYIHTYIHTYIHVYTGTYLCLKVIPCQDVAHSSECRRHYLPLCTEHQKVAQFLTYTTIHYLLYSGIGTVSYTRTYHVMFYNVCSTIHT